MIINIRGTSGTGKSSVVRRVMTLYPQKTRIKKEGRRQPLGYILEGFGPRPLAIPGHYETDCGGCDTIATYEEIYDLVRQAHAAGHHVLYEGLLISGEYARVVALHEEGYAPQVIALTTPVEEAIQRVNARRRAQYERRLAAGKSPKDRGEVRPRNTKAKARAVEVAMEHMQKAGVNAVWLDQEAAFLKIKYLLELNT